MIERSVDAEALRRRAAALAVVVLLLAGYGWRRNESLAEAGGVVAAAENNVDYSVSDFRLRCDLLTVVGPSKMKGCGYDLKLIHRPSGRVVFQRATSEADYDDIIDYSDLHLGVLRVTQLTFDPRKPGQDVPFVETAVRVFKDGRCETKEHLLLAAERGDAATVARWRDAALAAMARQFDERSESDYSDALEHLRNIAIGDPGPVRAALEAVRSKVTGHWGCILREYEGEVQLIAQIRNRQGR